MPKKTGAQKKRDARKAAAAATEDAESKDEASEVGVESKGDSKVESKGTDKSAKFQVVSEEGKGRFMVATSDLPVGSLVFRDTALLVVPKDSATCLACLVNHAHQGRSGACPIFTKRFGALSRVLADADKIAALASVDPRLVVVLGKLVCQLAADKASPCWSLLTDFLAPTDRLDKGERQAMLKACTLVRDRLPEPLQKVVNEEQMLTLLVAWNTNSHQTNDGGNGEDMSGANEVFLPWFTYPSPGVLV